MYILKQELAKKRKVIQEVGIGKKFIRRGDLENKKLEILREEEKRELERKAALHRPPSGKESEKEVEAGISSTKRAIAAEAEVAEDLIDKLVLPRIEVIRRLRVLKQPVTLFGEDDEERLFRLKVVMKTGDFDVEAEITDGQQNDFLKDLRNLKEGRFHSKGKDTELKNREEKDGGDEAENGDGDEQSRNKARKDDVDSKRMRANFDDLCAEDKILVYFKTILLEWEKEVDEMSDADKRTQQGRAIMATYRQCARYIDPLFKMCRRKQLYDDIRDSLSDIVKKCRERDYLAAMDKYIKLAIGNAPWPIGVTMVGIHERSAREKIHTNSVAHVMNDETTRKYLQSVKRLMTLAQRNYPALPSKSVEFNSLANGSDLESLKREEAVKEAQIQSAEQLRITADSHKS